MLRNKEAKYHKSNFWMVYADLMAGLLFVFILLFGAIVTKYVLTQHYLKGTQADLEQKGIILQESENKLAKKDRLLKELNSKLKEAHAAIALERKDKLGTQALLDETKLAHSKELEELASSLDEKDARILLLLDEMEQKDKKIASAKESMDEARQKLHDFAATKDSLIAALKRRLGSDVKIDEAGSLALPATVLFDKGEAELKEDSKEALKSLMQKYFAAILSEEAIRQAVSNIIIEGHTDSDGGYIYNLDLSQKRAIAVLEFLYQTGIDESLQSLLMAAGRSFSVPVYERDKNGDFKLSASGQRKEDKDKSRRIEIRIIFSDKAALKKLNTYLDSLN